MVILVPLQASSKDIVGDQRCFADTGWIHRGVEMDCVLPRRVSVVGPRFRLELRMPRVVADPTTVDVLGAAANWLPYCIRVASEGC